MILRILIHFALHVSTIIVVRMIFAPCVNTGVIAADLALGVNAGVISNGLNIKKCCRILQRKERE